ncbi:cation:proton antiporter [Streptomyces yaizuensis]|uniref:Cation:proton antiporter n=1 Tax=Streptomyces yaizuensis TaxID=2989713 RepID=A0ABQ5NRZ7_9ACTN|nr:cation:proton antiporter [Streptomyces sp. YSPA8]GLF93022.1 cation:proton antiporter [Streptomyces sp. YSPA8]
MSNSEIAIRFFLQLTVILAACRVVGLLARRLGQPQVVGEMITGVLLGPSLLGLLVPDWQERLFPAGSSMTVIYVVSQVGLVLYMFLVGLEFDTGLIRHRLPSAVSISMAGVFVPLVLGALTAYLLVQDDGRFFTEGVKTWQAMLFMGSAIAITAFPMLARIIFERRLTGTSLGTLALAAGATDDAISWCLLAVVLAVFKNDMQIAFLAIGGGIAYAVVVLTAGRRLLSRLGDKAERDGGVGSPVLSVVLMLLMLAAWFTDWVGIYAVFGAFILGAAMPRGIFAERIRAGFEPLTVHLLLPLFFVFSGLNTEIGLVNSPALWGVALLILLVSVLGKGVACWFAARLNKEPQREALAIGSLMNARGLMELILLNIGLQAGLITPTLFTILVFMAIVTTLMATPLFEFVYGRFRPQPTAGDSAPDGSAPPLAGARKGTP